VSKKVRGANPIGYTLAHAQVDHKVTTNFQLHELQVLAMNLPSTAFSYLRSTLPPPGRWPLSVEQVHTLETRNKSLT